MTSFNLPEKTGSKDRTAAKKGQTKKPGLAGKNIGRDSNTSGGTDQSGLDSDSSTEKGDSGAEASGVVATKGDSTIESKEMTVTSPVVGGNDVVLDTADTKGAGGEVTETVEKAAEGTMAESSAVPTVAQVPEAEVSEAIIKLDWIRDEVVKRLQAGAAWQKLAKSVYTISSVPHEATTFGNYKDSLLCYKGKPLTVSFVGRIMSTFFRRGNGEPARCASVRFKFMRDVDDRACRFLLYGKAKPVTVSTRKTFWAGSKRRVWNKLTQSSELQDFVEVYDGSKKVTNTRKMEKLDNALLAYNDLVLMECQVHRFTEGLEKGVGSTWTTRLRLIRVVRLYEAPPGLSPDPDSDEEMTGSDEVASDEDEDVSF